MRKSFVGQGKARFQDKANQRAFDSLSKNLQILLNQAGGGEDRAILYRDLKELGLVNGKGKLNVPLKNEVSELLPGAITPAEIKVDDPIAPTGLEVIAAFKTILVRWEVPAYRGHSHAEVWRSDQDALGEAVKIAVTQGQMYAEQVAPATGYYYWVRFVNAKDKVGPYQGTTGIYGETQADVGEQIEALSSELSNTTSEFNNQLTSALNTLSQTEQRIGVETDALKASVDNILDHSFGGIDHSELTGEGILNQVINAEGTQENEWATRREGIVTATKVEHPETGLAAAHTAIQTVAEQSSSLNEAVVNQVNQLEAVLHDADTGLAKTRAELLQEQEVRASADSATASTITALNAEMNTGLAQNQARIVSESEVRASEDEALASNISGLQVKVEHPDTGLTQAHARIDSEESARASGDAANASRLNSMEAVVNDPDSGLAKAHANITTESQVRASQDSALSQSISSLSASVNDPSTGLPRAHAKVSELTQAIANDTGDLISQHIGSYTVSHDGKSSSLTSLALAGYSAEQGFNAQWGIKTQVGDLQGGVGFYNNGSQTVFMVEAQKFAVLGQGTSVAPFIVSDGKVYINTAYINAATVQELVAGDVVADTIKAAASISSPVVSGGSISGANVKVVSGSYYVELSPNQSYPLYFGPSGSSKSAANARFLVDKYGNVLARGINIYNSAGSLVLSAGGEMDGAYISDLSVDSLKIANQAVTLPTSVSFATVHVNSYTYPSINIGTYSTGGVLFGLTFSGRAVNTGIYFEIRVAAMSNSKVLETHHYYLVFSESNCNTSVTCCGHFNSGLLNQYQGKAMYLSIQVTMKKAFDQVEPDKKAYIWGTGYVQYAKK